MLNLYTYLVDEGNLDFICTFKLSQDPLENFFSSIRMACGFSNNPTALQFKSAFQNLLCQTLNRKDNGNCLFDTEITVLEDITSTDIALDVEIEDLICEQSLFKENVLVYICGFIMRVLLKKESCLLCYTYLETSENRVTCFLIKNKQVGGLINPIVDIVKIVTITNRKCDRNFKN